MGVRALISYEGTNARELVEDFHKQAVIAALSQQISLNSFVEMSIRKITERL